MQRNALDLQRIEISPTDILQQHRSPRYQIRYTVIQFIHIKERIAAHIHQLTLTMLSLLTVLYRIHAILVGSQNLHILLVRESIAEMRHREDTMLHLLAILIEENRRRIGRICRSIRLRTYSGSFLSQIIRCLSYLICSLILLFLVFFCHRKLINGIRSQAIRHTQISNRSPWFSNARTDQSHQSQDTHNNDKTQQETVLARHCLNNIYYM